MLVNIKQMFILEGELLTIGVDGAIGMPYDASPIGRRRFVPAVMESPITTIRRVAMVFGKIGATKVPSLVMLSSVTTPPVALS